MKRKLYLLHRRLSIIIALPVLLWASSGLMHPIMTNIRPKVATQGYAAVAVDTTRIRVPLDTALRRRHIDSFAAVRLVHIDTNWFYQIRPVGAGAVPLYLSCTNGNVLPMGDWLYAQWLARYFLEGSGKTPAAEKKGGARSMGAMTGMAMPVAAMKGTAIPTSEMTGMAHDCCGAATECVLNPVRGAKVSNVSLVKAYDDEYKSINRLLPVYRVDFEREDGIRIYVETTQDRFSFAMDKRRAAFDTFFRICHTWGWLDWMGKGKLAVICCVALLAFVTAVLGVWIFFATARTATGTPRKTKGVRRLHRVVSIVAVLFTLMWSFSGAYHAFTQLVEPPDPVFEPTHFAAAGSGPDWSRLQAAVGKPMANIGMARIGDAVYWRVSLVPAKGEGKKDLMKDGKAAMAPVCYVHPGDYEVLGDGDKVYAEALATKFSGRPVAEAIGVTPVTAFDDEYNFTDKRLPVWRVSYAGTKKERVYVETCSGELAARVDNAAYAEGYSFSVFHKHHFMDWGGKTVRDASTMFWALAQVVMVVIGLLLFFRFRK